MSKNQITLIEPDNIVNYLIQKRLIDRKSIVEDKVIIKDVSRMNKNIQVLQENRTSYILKQASKTNEYQNKFVKKEARFYSTVFSSKKFVDIQAILPKFIKYDRKNSVLVIEFLKDVMQLSETLSQSKQQILYFGAIGKILAAYHSKFHRYVCDDTFRFLDKSLPMTLFVARPRSEIFSVISNGALDLLKTIQQKHEITEFLENIPDKWNPTTIIHGDMRMDNILIQTKPKNIPEIKVIDWELVSIGDPLWDVAGLLSDLVLQQFYSLISLGKTTGYSYESQLNLLTKKLSPVSKNFVRNYCQNLGKTEQTKDQFEENLLKFCIAKIIQTAFNSLQYSDTVTPIAEDIVQISNQMILNKDKMIKHILERGNDAFV